MNTLVKHANTISTLDVDQIETPSHVEPRRGRAGASRLAFEPQSMVELGAFSEMVVRSGLAPKSMKSPQAVALAIIQGRELGLTSCAALQGMTVINGQIGYKARLVAQLVVASPVCDLWQVIETGKEIVGRIRLKRRGWEEAQVVEYTIEDAKQARLWDSSDVWKRHPKDMLIARATTRAVVRHFPEVLGGVPMDVELQDKEQAQPKAQPRPKAQGGAALRAAVAELDPVAVVVVDTDEGARDEWRGLQSRLTELVGDVETKDRCTDIRAELDRGDIDKAGALDRLRAAIASIEAAGF